MGNDKVRSFIGCDKVIARKKLLLGGNIIGCVNITSQGYVKERVNVKTVEKFDKIAKNYKHFVWAKE